MVAEGEHLCQDFKYAISDPCKIARSLSAFANHRSEEHTSELQSQR